MKNEITDVQSALELTDSILNKKYLSLLSSKEEYSPVKLSMEEYALDLDKHARIFHLKRFVYDSEENFLNKLITVVNVAYALQGTILTAIESSGDVIDYYIGIAAKKDKGAAGVKNREALSNAFSGTILGNFGGSEIGDFLQGKRLEAFKNSMQGNVLCSVSVIPSVRDLEKTNIHSYVQGMENLVDSLKGRSYMLLTIADPVMLPELTEIRHGYENMYNSLLPFSRITRTRGNTKTLSLSKTDTESCVKGIVEEITRTQGKSSSVSKSNGFHAGISLLVQAGINHSKTSGTTTSDSVASSTQRSEQIGSSWSSTTGASHSSNDGIQMMFENRTIKSFLDKIEKNMERMDACEGLGAFQTATYVLADDRETALNVSGNFVSLMKGDSSSAQVSAVNCWERTEGETVFEGMLEKLRHLSHPVFKGKQEIPVSAAVLVSGPELTVQLGFPKKSVHGLTVLPMQPFGRNVPEAKQKIMLGQLQFLGRQEAQPVALEKQSLAGHVFVTGSTGTGKSNVVYQMLRELKKQGVHFLVIEPAKGEYKHIFGKDDGVRVFGTNPYYSPMLRINPFQFPEGMHVLEHIDRLIEIFNVCWPMYAAMPAVLKESVERAYLLAGWNLDTSENKYDRRLFPTFTDVLGELKAVVEESAFSKEVKDNYIGSLATRIQSLTNGIYGRIFGSEEIGDAVLFDSDTIVDLSRVGSMETKSMIMGILVMRLQEYRMTSAQMNAELGHVTVLEEAHQLLKRTSTEQSGESSNLLGKSVEMLSNAIAEIRTYGEGFIIADQAPALLDMSVIRNTNTKIIMRLPDAGDRELVGRAVNLSAAQIEEVARLKTGVGVVYQNEWPEAVLCRMHFEKQEGRYQYEPEHAVETGTKEWMVLKGMLAKLRGEHLEFSIQELCEYVLASSLSAYVKVKILRILKSRAIRELSDIQSAVYDIVCTPEIRSQAEHTESVEEWKQVFVYGDGLPLSDLDMEQQNIVLECILKEEVERFHKPEEYLEMWHRHVRGEVL